MGSSVSARNAPVIEKILDLARWAPSGDNTQPWRFEVTGDLTVTIHGFDTREYCVYDFDGHPSQISLGALLETLLIAASSYGMRAEIARREDLPAAKPTFDVRLITDPLVKPNPLVASITTRTVQRRAMRWSPLSVAQKNQLAVSVGAGFRVVWRESLTERWHIARLLFGNAGIRLTMPEAYEVHRNVIQFDSKFSDDRIPDQAIGLDPVSTQSMRWMMKSWRRINFFNTFLGGTVLPRVELDLIPALACGGHFAIVRAQPPSTIDDFVQSGAAIQRFWLTATQLQLFMQPEMTPLVFAWYVGAGKKFSSVPALWDRAVDLTRQWSDLLGADVFNGAVFIGRIGAGPPPIARSLRKPLTALMTKSP
ncbi:MAG: thiamine biosynthesis protein ThiF [Betaproteobacteria bacterium]|nr:thiamine biosynthesis protein ThiF [Betaproteobacteria bacterium]